jgi:hypothetical protein
LTSQKVQNEEENPPWPPLKLPVNTIGFSSPFLLQSLYFLLSQQKRARVAYEEGSEGWELNKLTIKQLKERLKDKGLKARGSKAEMIARLLGAPQSKKLPPPKAPVRVFFFFPSFRFHQIRSLQDMAVFVLEIAHQIRLVAAIDVYVCFLHTL